MLTNARLDQIRSILDGWDRMPNPKYFNVAALFEALRETLVDRDDHAARMQQAILVAVNSGGVDGAHHKSWAIDQMVRHLAGDAYEAIVASACQGENGPETYDWDTGIAP